MISVPMARQDDDDLCLTELFEIELFLTFNCV